VSCTPEARCSRGKRARGSKDAALLAAYASYLLGDGADPLADGSTVEAPAAWKALIKPPKLDGNTLEFWTYQGQLGGGPQAGPELRRRQVDLDTLVMTGASAEKVATGPQDAVETAKAKLDRAPFDQKQGAMELGRLCSDPRVPPILAAALARHKVPDTRKEIAKAMAGCKDKASVKALVGALRDSHAPVRTWAASSLAAIGDATAKAPLQQALAGEQDYEAQMAMKSAIAKLGG
jgi:HEAT repeat protein